MTPPPAAAGGVVDELQSNSTRGRPKVSRIPNFAPSNPPGADAPGGQAKFGIPAGLQRSSRGLKHPVAFIGVCILLGGGAYLALEYGLPRTPFGTGSHQLAVFIGFLAVPFTVLLHTRRKPELGGLDRGFLAGIGMYIAFAMPLLLLVPANPAYFRGYHMAAPAFAAWAFLTLIQVSSVDLFTKRIVQLEIERLWGPGKGMLAQFAVWCGAHVIEYAWLKEIAGPAGAVLFLGVTGAVSGFVYWKTKNVLGMMVGHWVLNLVLAAAALLYYP